MQATRRRRGSDTRAEIQEVALTLFTEKGYEATSLREIAERLGITKAALYYHFKSKEDIVHTLLDDRLEVVDELISWASAQPRTPDLPRKVVDRWAETISDRGLRMVRFALANQHVLREFSPKHAGMHGRLRELFAILTDPQASVADQLRVRMALISVQVAIVAAQDLDADDEEIIDVAKELAHLMLPPVGGPADAQADHAGDGHTQAKPPPTGTGDPEDTAAPGHGRQP
ncbi:TetR/AcrR family transcriptional regulator [Allostreptomyces psammosilenae]|uniref:AcrR family transcriptional regulator n=1 Tax=Allostreptomyces psammosilenae TaxID=1892865 RepID=A0A853A3C2_9ACTN|nr:TetR/AcrR family transcriptional regulator [Allostreptomyces psammosilenae]NYI07970.1 AcrR family transcriptional regulator [Allostreptomyces psammosilenae]